MSAWMKIGLADLHTLFKRVADKTGEAPMVIDSDELLARPNDYMRKYFAAFDLPENDEALSWEAKNENPTWNQDSEGFHDSLKQSSGLAPQKRDYPPIESSPHMQRLYDACLPHYEALQQYRISI